jgi:hypothetical protein
VEESLVWRSLNGKAGLGVWGSPTNFEQQMVNSSVGAPAW